MTELMQNNKKPKDTNARTIEEYEEQLRYVSDAMPAPSGKFDKSAKARAARSMGAVEETPVDIDEEVKPKKKKKKQKEEEENQYSSLVIGDSRPLAIEDSSPVAIDDSNSVEKNAIEYDEGRPELIKSAMKKEPLKSAMKKSKKEEEIVVGDEEEPREKKKSKSKKDKKPKSERGETPQAAEKAKKSKKKKKKPDDSGISQPVEREIEPENSSGPTAAPACCSIL
jgi:hypothetical protein